MLAAVTHFRIFESLALLCVPFLLAMPIFLSLKIAKSRTDDGTLVLKEGQQGFRFFVAAGQIVVIGAILSAIVFRSLLSLLLASAFIATMGWIVSNRCQSKTNNRLKTIVVIVGIWGWSLYGGLLIFVAACLAFLFMQFVGKYYSG